MKKCWRQENGKWILKDVVFTEKWDAANYRLLTESLQNTVKSGGTVFGAFDQEKLLGFASLENVFMGLHKQYLPLSSIHVSCKYRGRGIGNKLFHLICAKAQQVGVEKLYISAHSAEETQAFYQAMGCVDAREVQTALAAREPCDRQLEYDLNRLIIRQEHAAEYRLVEELLRNAFWDVYRPGCSEHYLAHRIRADKSYMPELSLVAEIGGRLAGCIFYTSGAIVGADGCETSIVEFGPLAVAAEYQNQGVGSALVNQTKQSAAEAGYPAVAIFGNPAYYRRFGFQAGQKYGITDSDGNFCDSLLVMELREDALKGVAGNLRANPAFYMQDEDIAEFDKTFPPKQKHALASQFFLGTGTIRPTAEVDFEEIYEIINDAAIAYKGVIPADYWHTPYMPREELREQIDAGVVFYGYYANSLLIGVMGIQDKGEVDLIRHAYVRSTCRQLGIGGKLLEHLHAASTKPMLIGTWTDAFWVLRFYEKHGFKLVSDLERKNALLRKFWNIPDCQVETSVVLTNGEI